MACIHTSNKTSMSKLRSAMYNFDETDTRKVISSLFTPDAIIHMPLPLGDMTGPDELYDTCYKPLLRSVPDLERRDWIVVGGLTKAGDEWVGCGGHYTGTFTAPWLDIPPTGHLVHMRFHEFYKFWEGKIVEVQAIWDVPEVMMQANSWPMAPSLGREYHIPGPATLDGIVTGPWNKQKSDRSCSLVIEMLEYMKLHPSTGGPEVMEMERFWHPKMNWYGPAGIGTGRGISGFRHWHQIPFLNGMPDRGKFVEEIVYHFFGDEDYAAVTGWPNMIQTLSDDGWMGIAPSGKRVNMCSLDFWRIENGLIRENWVLVDLLDMYRQIGVDVLARMREFNKCRNLTID